VRILAVYRHYWPDTTPYARLLRMILERLADDGHEVSVIAGQPSYNDARLPRSPWSEQLGGVKVRRVWLPPERKSWRLVRLLNACLFLLRAVVHATLFRRYDIVIANSQPPVLIGLALRCIAKLSGARYVLHMQDIHPESLSAVGRLSSNSAAYRLLRRIEGASARRAHRIVTLSEDMRMSLESRGDSLPQIRIVNNCAPNAYEDACQLPPELWRSDAVKLLFAGNLGAYQAIPELIEAVTASRSQAHIGLTFMGTGSLEKTIRDAADWQTIRVVERQPASVANAAMLEADYGVVSLAPGVIRYAYPSKTLVYLSAGLPLLVVAERDCELSRMVMRHRLGIVAPDTTPLGIARAFDEAVQRKPEWTPERRAAIGAFYQQEFAASQILSAWSRLVRETELALRSDGSGAHALRNAA
jgi:hypothetical protein